MNEPVDDLHESGFAASFFRRGHEQTCGDAGDVHRDTVWTIHKAAAAAPWREVITYLWISAVMSSSSAAPLTGSAQGSTLLNTTARPLPDASSVPAISAIAASTTETTNVEFFRNCLAFLFALNVW